MKRLLLMVILRCLALIISQINKSVFFSRRLKASIQEIFIENVKLYICGVHKDEYLEIFISNSIVYCEKNRKKAIICKSLLVKLAILKCFS